MIDPNRYKKIDGSEVFFDYRRISHYIYCYLNPFKFLDEPISIKINPNIKDLLDNPIELKYIFYYEPIYIGKAVSFKGYRHNVHLSEFLQNKYKLKSIKKYDKFAEIEYHMKNLSEQEHIIYNLPRNWREYKDNWIEILYYIDGVDSSNKEQADKILEEVEKEIIKECSKHFKLMNIIYNK